MKSKLCYFGFAAAVLFGLTLQANAWQAPPRSHPLADDQIPEKVRPLFRSARLGAEWLFQANAADGRFRGGVNPVLNIPIGDDGFLAQAEAAMALAQAARMFGEERLEVRAKQALLNLFTQTKLDPQDNKVRFTSMPAASVNRVAAASYLVRAVHELAQPDADLLEQSEQLCNFLRTTQQPDGSFQLGEQTPSRSDLSPEAAMQDHLAGHGLVVMALMKSNGRQPAAWKMDAVRKAHDFYRSRWQSNKQPGPVPGLMLAFAEMYQQTKERAFADAVFEMGDWLLELQYPALPRQPLFEGGFAGWQENKIQQIAPTADGAVFAEALAAAGTVARQAGDVSRFERYRVGMEKHGQFLITHQFTLANTTQFADWFKENLAGSFFSPAAMGSNPLSGTARATRALLSMTAHFAGERD